MALSGAIYTSIDGGGYKLQIEWSATQSIANNTSTITSNLYWISTGSSYTINSTATKTGSNTIDGTAYSFSGAGLAGLSENQKKLINTSTKTVAHNADGTKTASLAASFDCAVTLSGTYYGTVSISSTNITLDTIPRASTPTLGSGTADMGTTITIYTNRASTSFTHTISFAFGSASGTIATNVGDSTTWTLPLSTLAPQIPNDVQGTGTITCNTYSGGTLIGTKTVSFIANVPSSVVPTITSITGAETVSTVSTIVGLYVQNLSRIQFTINGALGVYGSSITTYYITINGTQYTGSTVTSPTLNVSGNITVTGQIIDSRGRSATVNITVNLLAYLTPLITTFSISRCNSDGTANDLGIYAKIISAGSITSLINSTQKNQLTYTLYSRVRGTTTWTSIKTLILAVGTLALSATDILGTYAAASAYDFMLYITDKFNTTLSTLSLSTGLVTMSWNKNGVGIGKVYQQGALDVAGDIYTTGVINSTVATGTAPIVVASSTKVTNLNADLVDGYNADTANTANAAVVRDANKNINVSSIDSLAYFDTTNNRVGINTSTPSVTFQVGGAANISGAVNMGSTLTVTGNIVGPRPVCKVRQTTAQGIATATTTAMVFQAEDIDTDSMFSGSGSDHLTINTAGNYRISGAIQNAASNYNIYLYNGATILIQLNGVSSSTAQFNSIFNLAAGASLYLKMYQATGSSQSTNISSANAVNLCVEMI